MVKVFGPMMSLDASGTLADAVTFAKWKGRNYARQRVIPSNPESGAQVGRRAMLSFLSRSWSGISAGDQATFQDLADDLIASPFNAYQSINLRDWHNYLAPSETFARARALTGSDNQLTAAAWEENRIKLTLGGTAMNDAWGIVVFGTPGAAITPEVGNAIIVDPDLVFAEHHIYWTPPTVAQYTFDTRAFATDGKWVALGGPQTAAAP